MHHFFFNERMQNENTAHSATASDQLCRLKWRRAGFRGGCTRWQWRSSSKEWRRSTAWGRTDWSGWELYYCFSAADYTAIRHAPPCAWRAREATAGCHSNCRGRGSSGVPRISLPRANKQTRILLQAWKTRFTWCDFSQSKRQVKNKRQKCKKKPRTPPSRQNLSNCQTHPKERVKQMTMLMKTMRRHRLLASCRRISSIRAITFWRVSMAGTLASRYT